MKNPASRLAAPRILILRLSHIGDCVLTLPMLNAIRDEFPDAFIGWAIERPSLDLVNLHPAVDQWIEVPKNWAKKPRSWPSLISNLRKHKFDTVIDPQGITKSALLGWMSGAKTRIGIDGKWGRELSPRLNNLLVKQNRSHLVDRSLELLQPLGIVDAPAEFRFPICEQARQQVDSFLLEKKIQSPFAIINPGASWPSKRWVNQRFAEVARHCHDQHSLMTVVTWAGDEEHQMAREIVELADNSAILAPKTSLRELAALCQRGSFFVGCDTGPLHIATATGIRCVGLYGTTRPEESGAYGDQHQSVQKWYQGGGSRERRAADNQAMQDIQVQDVNEAVHRLLAQGDHRVEDDQARLGLPRRKPVVRQSA